MGINELTNELARSCALLFTLFPNIPFKFPISLLHIPFALLGGSTLFDMPESLLDMA